MFQYGSWALDLDSNSHNKKKIFIQGQISEKTFADFRYVESKPSSR